MLSGDISSTICACPLVLSSRFQNLYSSAKPPSQAFFDTREVEVKIDRVIRAEADIRATAFPRRQCPKALETTTIAIVNLLISMQTLHQHKNYQH
jgi:hypothetical protein